MKKHELLKKAYDEYPKGTLYKWGPYAGRIESTGVFNFNDDAIVQNDDYMVFDGNVWAEIVKPKIAVKVENEKEFDALMKYYDSLGYINPLGFKKFPQDRVKKDGCLFVTFESNYIYPHNNWQESTKHLNPAIYNQIPFSDFAKQHNIKLPLLKSEDCVWLYEGDRYFMFDYEKGDNGAFDDFRGEGFKATHFPLRNYDQHPVIFSTKQAALDWIEAQKPKQIEIKLTNSIEAIITTDKVVFKMGDKKYSPQFFNKQHIESIHKAMQELS